MRDRDGDGKIELGDRDRCRWVVEVRGMPEEETRFLGKCSERVSGE